MRVVVTADAFRARKRLVIVRAHVRKFVDLRPAVKLHAGGVGRGVVAYGCDRARFDWLHLHNSQSVAAKCAKQYSNWYSEVLPLRWGKGSIPTSKTKPGGSVCIACLSKDCRHLRDAPAPPALTPRELEVIALIGACEQNKAIAFELQISEGTVKSHVRSVYAKMRYSGSGSRVRLALWARDHAALLAA